MLCSCTGLKRLALEHVHPLPGLLIGQLSLLLTCVDYLRDITTLLFCNPVAKRLILKGLNKHRPYTDANGNPMLRSFFSKLFKEEIGSRYTRTASIRKTEKKSCFLYIIFSGGCTRRNLRFHVENCQHTDKKQLTRR